MTGDTNMPDRTYRGRVPPSAFDRIFAHPWELVISAWSAFIGIATAVSILTSSAPSPSIDRLPAPLIFTLAGLLVAGGVYVARGVFSNDPDLMVGFTRERVGLICIATAWTVYAVSVIFAHPESVSSWSSGLAIALCAALRFIATVRLERTLRGET